MIIKNKLALVTGASTGIGRAIAIELGDKKVNLALLGKNIVELEKTKSIIESRNMDIKIRIYKFDLSESKNIEHIVSCIIQQQGNISILANVAGVWHNKNRAYYGIPLHEIAHDEIENVININLLSVIYLTKAVSKNMITNKEGKIINISGTFSEGGANWIHYFVSKTSIEKFTEALSEELIEHKIQVNCISPSDVSTDSLKKFFPNDAENALTPKNIANLLIDYCENPIYKYVTGQTIVIKKT